MESVVTKEKKDVSWFDKLSMHTTPFSCKHTFLGFSVKIFFLFFLFFLTLSGHRFIKLLFHSKTMAKYKKWSEETSTISVKKCFPMTHNYSTEIQYVCVFFRYIFLLHFICKNNNNNNKNNPETNKENLAFLRLR